MLRFLFVLVFFYSCSSIKPLNQAEEIQEQKIFIEEEEPTSEGSAELVKKTISNHKILFLGKGLSSFMYVGMLKSLKKKKIRIKSVTGTGWGSLIAALYAKYDNINMVEWKSFKYFNEDLPYDTKNFKISLYKRYKKLLEKEFKNENEYSLKKIFAKPPGMKLYNYLLTEMKKARKQEQTGVYWDFTQSCDKLENFDIFKNVCLKITDEFYAKLDLSGKSIITLPLQDLESSSLSDLIARGKNFSDNILN